jgi:hypothetical protein
MLFPPFRHQHPGPIRHRWLVAYMLAMATLEVGHPITVFVQMKSDNGLLHARTSVSSSSSIPTQTAENRLCAIETQYSAHLGKLKENPARCSKSSSGNSEEG